MAEGGDKTDHHERPLTLHIRNLPEGATSDEAFVMYLENVTGEDGINVVEYSDTFNEALVMLDNLSIDLEDVKTRIRQKPFLGSTLEVEDALPNNRVWVTNLKPAIDKETLELYFEQAKLNPNGGSVEVEYDEPNHMAIINYSDASAVDIVLSADRSKTQMLGPNVVIEHCKFFDSLYSSVESVGAVGAEEPYVSDEHDGVDVNDEHTVEADETITSPDEIGSVDRGRGGRGRSDRPGGRRGGRRGRRQGRGGFAPDGQRIYERRDSQSSQHSEPAQYGERSMLHDQGGPPRGNRRPFRGRGAMGDAGRPRYSRDRRPQSASRGEYSADQFGANNEDGAPRGGPRNRRGDHPHYFPRGGGRRGDGGQNRGQGRGGMYQRADSIPSLLDQPLTLPTDSGGFVRKEIEVQKEAGNEKCHLLTTMIRDVKRHGCEARIDMRRHVVTLNGPSAAVTAAAETVYSQLLAMHSLELELPARLAQMLATPRGHYYVVNFFKSAQLRVIYYTNERSIPSIVASDEYSANSAKVLLMRKIKSVDIPYAKWHKPYLQSEAWNQFVNSAENTWLLNIEVTLSNVIRVTGIEDDVHVATDSIRSQLSGLEKPVKGKSGSASRQEQEPRPYELPGEQLPQQLPAALDTVEVSKPCPICGLEFPQSSITDHVNLCSRSQTCPICSKTFPATTPSYVFSIHVNAHFEDSDLV